MSQKRSSLLAFRLKKTLDTLASKEGRHTELISLYVPPGRQISDVMNNLRQEYGTASNIKSKTTRKNVQDAIEKVMQRLRLFKEPPPNGLIIFCGALPQNGPGSERIETYVIEPPEPIDIYYYRCDSRFYIEPLWEMLRVKDTYGILVMDGSGAAFATLRGRKLELVKAITSGLPGKHRAGGQSARRFERLREAEVNEYFKRVGNYADEIFLQIPDLKGIIIGGPGPTKEIFQSGDHLHYTLKGKILATVNTAYVGEQGVKEVLEKSPEILREVRYVKERRLVQDFLYELGHDTGLATYGEDEVRQSLYKGRVKILLLSEELDRVRVTVGCASCGYSEQRTMRRAEVTALVQETGSQACPECSNPALSITETGDLVDELAELAEQTGADVEIISVQTEEGVALKESFGGVAAILRFKESP
ncbi:MAG: peptide chain release factor aRF-1 [Candidatus Bathyarchaeia archaeon]